MRRSWPVYLKAIAYYNLVLLAFVGFLVAVTAADSLAFVLPVAGLALLIGLVTAGVWWLIRRRRPSRRPFWRFWLEATGTWALLFLALAGGVMLWALAHNATQPLAVPRVVITDGEKEVVFQGMVHIGSEPYYQSVVFDIAQAAEEGYVLLFEGVLPGTEENTDRLNQLLGTDGEELDNYYASTADRCGLRFQTDYFHIFVDDLDDNPSQFVNADVSVDDIMAEWDRLVAADPSLVDEQPESEPVEAEDDATSQALDVVAELTPGQRSLVALACQTIFNLRLAEHEDGPPFSELVVLDYRNRYLTDAILNHPSNELYVVYGYGHFPGVFEMLQEADSSWEIVDVRWIQVIEQRDELERELRLE